MEAKGAVNEYRPYKGSGSPIFVINLANGVTPFIHFFEGKEYDSSCYQLTRAVITVTHAHYRPTKEEFDTFKEDLQEHFLNGGLHLAELDRAKQMHEDPVQLDWDFEKFQAWCLSYYGKKLKC